MNFIPMMSGGEKHCSSFMIILNVLRLYVACLSLRVSAGWFCGLLLFPHGHRLSGLREIPFLCLCVRLPGCILLTNTPVPVSVCPQLVAIAKAANNGIDVADTVIAIPGWYTDSMRSAMLVSVLPRWDAMRKLDVRLAQ